MTSQESRQAICDALNKLFWKIPTRKNLNTEEWAQWLIAELIDAGITGIKFVDDIFVPEDRSKCEVVIISRDALPCSLETFTIRGINADSDDFGSGGDNSPDEAEPYGCGNWEFHGKAPTEEVLHKYDITLDEYANIVARLESALYVGSCGWCI